MCRVVHTVHSILLYHTQRMQCVWGDTWTDTSERANNSTTNVIYLNKLSLFFLLLSLAASALLLIFSCHFHSLSRTQCVCLVSLFVCILCVSCEFFNSCQVSCNYAHTHKHRCNIFSCSPPAIDCLVTVTVLHEENLCISGRMWLSPVNKCRRHDDSNSHLKILFRKRTWLDWMNLSRIINLILNKCSPGQVVIVRTCDASSYTCVKYAWWNLSLECHLVFFLFYFFKNTWMNDTYHL